MNPSWHIGFGTLFSLFLFFFFPEIGITNISIFFFSSILIDVDHYLFYIYEKRGFNLKQAYFHFINNKKEWKHFRKDLSSKPSTSFFIFHGLEVLLFILVISLFFNSFYFVFIGFSFHLFLDLTEQVVYSKEIKKISIVNDFLNYRR